MQLTTLSPPALIGDGLLVWWLYWATYDWPRPEARTAMYVLSAWMVFSKTVKLMPHFARHPVDVFLWPVSVLFGWMHGIIKLHALITLNEVGRILADMSRRVTNVSRLHGDLVLVRTLPTRNG